MKDYIIKKGFVIQKMEDEYVLFDPDTSTLHTINETGALIFDMMKRKASVQSIENKMATKYKISKNKAKKDISFFTDSLLKKNIIKNNP